MATAVHMDYTLPLKQGTSFKFVCKHGMNICGLFVQSMQLHTHQLYKKREVFLKYCS